MSKDAVYHIYTDLSIFYNECRDRFGFDDGAKVPIDAKDRCGVLAEALNALLPDDCPVRAVLMLFGGNHNTCRLRFQDKNHWWLDNQPEPAEVPGILRALDVAGFMSLVRLEVTIKPAAERQALYQHTVDLIQSYRQIARDAGLAPLP